MEKLEQFSELVGVFYDSALDPTRWTDALERACRFVEGCAANVFYQSNGSQAVTLFHSFGEDEDYRQLYVEKYAKLNPLFPASSFLAVGSVNSVSDIIPIDEFRQTRLYKEWVQPQGILDALYTNLEKSTTGAAALAIRRREADGLFDDDAKARFGLIIPHVRRAVAIGKVVEAHRAKESSLASTLDGLDTAVLLVTADNRLVYVNAKGADMLTAGTLLHAGQGRLAAVDARANRDLRDAVAGAAQGDGALGVKGIAISLKPGDKSSEVAHVLPLTSGSRRDMGLNAHAVAALFVGKPAIGAMAPLEIVAQLHGLTAGEVRVLAVVAESDGVATMAQSLGIAEATVRTHLHSVFTKTGTRRQADLIKLLAGYASPLRAS